MNHPHQSFLDEFRISIDKLVPLTPPEIKEEALKLHEELSSNPDATAKQIHQALSLIGRKEYPYRKAYNELCAGDEEQRLQKLVFERVDDTVKKKVQDVTQHGVMLDDFVTSDMFEELKPEERLQIEQAILLAEDTLDHQCDERAHKRQQDYEDLVKQWTQEAARLQGLVDNLRAMGDEDPKWKGEIDSVCDRLEEGWSVVERDPTEEEIKKELEYWNTVLHETED